MAVNIKSFCHSDHQEPLRSMLREIFLSMAEFQLSAA